MVPAMGHSGKGKRWRQWKDRRLPGVGEVGEGVGRAQIIFRAVKFFMMP